MFSTRIARIAAAVVFLIGLASCGQPAQDTFAQQLTSTLNGTRQTLTDAQAGLSTAATQLDAQARASSSEQARQIVELQTQVATLKGQLAAQPTDAGLIAKIEALQSQVTTLARQPGSGVDATVAAALEKLGQITIESQKVLATVIPQAQAYAAQIRAAATQPNPDAAATAASVQAGTGVASDLAMRYGGPNGLAISLVTTLIGGTLAEYFRRKAATAEAGKAQNAAALSSAVDGLQQAIAAGQIVVSPQAAGTVDSRVVAHPGTDRLVDVLSAAPAAPATPPVK